MEGKMLKTATTNIGIEYLKMNQSQKEMSINKAFDVIDQHFSSSNRGNVPNNLKISCVSFNPAGVILSNKGEVNFNLSRTDIGSYVISRSDGLPMNFDTAFFFSVINPVADDDSTLSYGSFLKDGKFYIKTFSSNGNTRNSIDSFVSLMLI